MLVVESDAYLDHYPHWAFRLGGKFTKEYPYYWGYRNERGKAEAVGSNLNLPLPLGIGDAEYLKAVDRACRAIQRFAPKYLIISAGFDTHADDPIGGFKLSLKAYPKIGERIAALDLPTLISQEGGYNLNKLGRSVRDFLCITNYYLMRSKNSDFCR